jgi:hypothetical protein
MVYPYRITLTEAQRAELRGLVGSGTAAARMLTRARILLKADHGEGGQMRRSSVRSTSMQAPSCACVASS